MDILKPYLPHLDVLRWHLVRIVAVWIICGIVVFTYGEPVMGWMTTPLTTASPNAALLATGVTEIFAVYMRLALWGGFALALPYTLLEMWRFIRPALYPHERRGVVLGLMAVPLMSLLGAAFAWTLLLPTMLTFFLGLTAPHVTSMPHVADYIGFVITTVGLMALAFNIPLILVGLMRWNIVNVDTLRAQRRTVIITLFIIAAIVTPTPDPFSQIMVAVPLCLLFEIALAIGARITPRNS